MGVSSCSVALVVVMMAIAADGVAAGVTGALPSHVLRERIVLDQKGRYVMLWTPQENDIIIEVQVATAGYVGLGFSPKGGMKGADIVMGWVDDSGQVILHDRHSDGYTVPKVDESQDVELLGGYQNDTHTVLRFSRPWVTCDHNDIRLSGDTVRLVWFFANEDPTDDMTMKDHDQQGERSILLKEPTFVAPILDDHIKAWELLAPNVTLPHDLDTLYWCKIFKIPPIKSKNQFIGYMPVIQEGNEQYVHHMVLFECKLPKSSLHYEKWLGVEGRQCYSSSMPRSWNHCKTPIMAWAVGSAGEMFPEHVGFPMGEEYDGATYYRMEMHYDNKDLKQGIVDASGLRMFYTDILRPHDAATVGFGHMVSPLHIIPPGQRNWFTVAFCSGECTQQILPPDGIHVFQGLLHSHLLGRAISLRQIRNGRELPPLLVDKSYDFNYQQGRILRDEMTILPGDSFITECDYDSGDRPNPTFGGLGTYEEMCVVYVSFYPRINATMCGSIPQPKNIYKSLGIEEMEEKQHYDAKHMYAVDEEQEVEMVEKMMQGNDSRDMVLIDFSQMLRTSIAKGPKKYFNISLYDIVHDDATWEDEQVVAALQYTVVNESHLVMCSVADLGNDMDTYEYPEFTSYVEPEVQKCDDSTVMTGGSLEVTDLVHRIVLDPSGGFVMLWTPREDDIIIEVQVATAGYVGVGFSPKGGMKGADIVLGWVDDANKIFLHDRYSDGYTVPKVDESQDVELLGGYQNDTHTVLRFSRPWVTCDHNDIRLSDDTVRIIWSYANQDPSNEMTMKIHDKRGTKSVFLKERPVTLPSITDDIKFWDIAPSNVSLPDDLTTLYWCKLFKIPPINRKVHIIGYTSMIEERNQAHLHHILLYECHLPDSARYFEKWLDVDGAQCYGPNMPISWKYCRYPIIAWGIGGEGEMLPDHTGFPIGEEYGGATYFLMEVHYDNPSLKPGIVDSSGLRIFYTENLRQHDAGILMMGHIITPTHIIPPSHNWLTVGHCHESCTQQNLPSGGIHVFQGVLHSHLLGSSLSLRHIRDGQELPRLIKDMNYDFNYQQSRILKQEVTILPGDHLITECNYDSSRRRAPTFGGFGTEEEMCLAFLGYYPRSNWTHCLSAPQLRTILDGLGVEDIYNKDIFLGNGRDAQESVDEEAETEMARAMSSDGYNKRTKPLHMSYMLDKLVIKAPEKYYNKSLYSILHDDATWQDEALVERLQDLVITGRHKLKCPIRHNRTIPGVARTATYPDFVPFEPTDDQCGNNEPGSTSAAMPPAVNPVDNTISA